MKKPVQKILLLIITLYFLTAYTDFKKGFIEGFLQKNEKPVKATIKDSNSENYYDLNFPVIIKMY